MNTEELDNVLEPGTIAIVTRGAGYFYVDCWNSYGQSSGGCMGTSEMVDDYIRMKGARIVSDCRNKEDSGE